MSEFTLIGLRVLREVAAKGSFTAAADSLGYTQSAVSRQIAALENAAGAPLFERESRGVRLSAAGHVLLRHAAGVLDQVEAARRELSGLRGSLTGRLRVGAFPTAVAALVPRALRAFGARYPGVGFTLREGITSAQLRRLGTASTDLAVVGALPAGPLADPRFAFDPLLDDPLLLAVARDHPLARRRSVELDDLRTESWIAGGANANDTFLGVWQKTAWQPRIEFVVREWTAKLGLVAAGLGVTLVPGIAAGAVREDVALVRIREQPARRAVVIATRAASELSPHARAFADILHDVAAELAVELQQRIDDR